MTEWNAETFPKIKFSKLRCWKSFSIFFQRFIQQINSENFSRDLFMEENEINRQMNRAYKTQLIFAPIWVPWLFKHESIFLCMIQL